MLPGDKWRNESSLRAGPPSRTHALTPNAAYESGRLMQMTALWMADWLVWPQSFAIALTEEDSIWIPDRTLEAD